MTPEVYLSRETITRYAAGKGAPYVGLPVCEDGSRRAAVFMRKHLAAAIGSDVQHAVYSHESHTLKLNGGKAVYVLKDLLAPGSPFFPLQIQEEQEKWADRERKSILTRKLPANLKLDAKRRAEVEKLERRLAKVGVYRPHNPCLASPDAVSDYERETVARWAAERAQRKALGKLYGKYLGALYNSRGRFPWAAVVADVEAIGLRIDSYNAWARVRTRIAHKGIDIPDYLKSLWTFASLARKPRDLEPAKINERIENYQANRKDYFDALRERQFILDQIANVKAGSEPLALELAVTGEVKKQNPSTGR